MKRIPTIQEFINENVLNEKSINIGMFAEFKTKKAFKDAYKIYKDEFDLADIDINTRFTVADTSTGYVGIEAGNVYLQVHPNDLVYESLTVNEDLETEVKTIYKAKIQAAEHSDHYEEGESVKPLRTWDKEIENNDLKTLLIEISLYILGSKDFKDILSYDNINDYDWGSELWASKGPLDKRV